MKKKRYSRFVWPLALMIFMPCCLSLRADSPRDFRFRDDFTSAKLDARRAVRGDWKFEDGIATCTQDDALYKQHQDHGPIIFYDIPVTDAVIQFQYKADACKTFVFTANGEQGHVFRFITSDRGTNLRAFPPDGDAKSIALAVDAKQVLKGADWVAVTVTLRGTKASVKLGEARTLTVEHASLARPKTNLSVGFSFGTLAVKEFTVR